MTAEDLAREIVGAAKRFTADLSEARARGEDRWPVWEAWEMAVREGIRQTVAQDIAALRADLEAERAKNVLLFNVARAASEDHGNCNWCAICLALKALATAHPDLLALPGGSTSLR